MEKVQIPIKFSGNVSEKAITPSARKLDSLCYWWRHADVIFLRIKKLTWPAGLSHLTDSRQVVIHAVMQCT